MKYEFNIPVTHHFLMVKNKKASTRLALLIARKFIS